MKAYIKGIAYYLPEAVLTNEELVEQFPEWTVDKISKKVGISERHVTTNEETAGDMAIKAAEKLISEKEIDRSIIDFVLLCTQSPDYHLPSTSCIIQDKLGLSRKCGAFDFNLIRSISTLRTREIGLYLVMELQQHLFLILVLQK